MSAPTTEHMANLFDSSQTLNPAPHLDEAPELRIDQVTTDNAAAQEYGRGDFWRLSSCGSLTAAQTLARIRSGTSSFTGSAPAPDEITLVAIRRL